MIGLARACARFPCANAAVRRGLCRRHLREEERRHLQTTLVYRTSLHKQFRDAVLARDPLCRACGVAKATVADHIVPLRAGGGWSLANGQGLCAGCHSRKTATMDRGYRQKKSLASASAPERAAAFVRRARN